MTDVAAAPASAGAAGDAEDLEFDLEGVAIFADPAGFYRPDPMTRHVSFNDAGEELTLSLVGGHPLWGHYLWNAAVVAAEYIVKTFPPAMLQAMTFVELGAGAGLPSIVAARHGARHVVATDYPDNTLLRNLEDNVRRCVPERGYGPAAAVHGLKWGCGPDDQWAVSQFDVIVLSDLIFNHSQHANLLQTCAMLSGPSTVILVTFSHHRPHKMLDDLKFFEVARDQFGLAVRHVESHRCAPMFPNDPGDVEIRSTVQVYELRRSTEEQTRQ